ncbi:MAG: Cytochrome c-type biosis protein CcmF [Pseudomonadota bacterium]|jgi:cytochrome c-type biogenesis protein CcmF
MIAELGHFALILAAVLSALLAVVPGWGVHRRQWVWMAMARPLTVLMWSMLALAFACLANAFLTNDFSVEYVAQHSNTLLPRPYQFAAIWGGHEGSLLLWIFLLATWMLAVAAFSRSLPQTMVARVLSILGWVSLGFLLFILFTSNPFERILPAPQEGRDLNPLLQDPGLVIHPPMLYMGYVGTAVAFAFALSALLAGRLDAAWARWSRPWTVIAWAFLTLGIGLGSWWAYYELGWGGWWFWDPVENASLQPWLVLTALIHSLSVTEKRGGFKAWTVLLAIAGFSLSLLGTFLVRSGVLTSVHAFASDPTRGVFILLFLAVVVGVSLTIFALKAPQVMTGSPFALLSRESFLLANSVLQVVATLVVMLGTLYPLVMDALNLGKLSVGPPYFNLVFVPMMVPVLFLLVPGVVARWRQADLGELVKTLWPTAISSLVVGNALSWWMGPWQATAALGFTLGAWVGLSSLAHMLVRLLKPGRIAGSFWGMHLAHLGLAIVVMGITGVKHHEVERDVRMGLGDTVEIAPYTFRLASVGNVPGPNYMAVEGRVEVLRNGQVIDVLRTQKRKYVSSAMPMTEAGIDSNAWRDLYVSMGDPLPGNTPQWAMRVYYKPFVPWLWGGALLMTFAGVIAALDRRYRRASATAASPTGVAASTGSA